MIHLQLHKPRSRYTEEEKMLSKQLYYYSASAFCRLRKAGCNFPGQRTIRRWVEEYNIKPGFCDIIFQKLKEKITQIPEEERLCALKWDEMSIKNYEEYSSKLDEIEGLVDLGPLGKQSERILKSHSAENGHYQGKIQILRICYQSSCSGVQDGPNIRTKYIKFLVSKDYATRIQWNIYFQNFGNVEDLILIQLQEWFDYQLDIYYPLVIFRQAIKGMCNVLKVKLSLINQIKLLRRLKIV
ncbi:PREDICTED: uncharacterized protein LOC105571225 isoform X2 [Vollenhovia emeryi]|uniref:uncharacterized protein LOC105571225 isoform X2 n=1 Tax=Vollenhovia emeryi TaxID=411798 RepID=UPI0005F4FD96|nr:PREDICTED: uncharacterized protein LOC105571225 isoform X2 [Vollenhovia emeryi]